MTEAAITPNGSPQSQVRKILVLTFHRADWAAIEEMHREAQLKLPDMQVESVCNAILAEACRVYRDRQAAGAVQKQ